MSLCTKTPGYCMKQADCPDTRCPGRPELLDDCYLTDGLRHLHTEDGGTWITEGHRVLRLRPIEAQDEPIHAPKDPSYRFYAALGLAIAVAVVGWVLFGGNL